MIKGQKYLIKCTTSSHRDNSEGIVFPILDEHVGDLSDAVHFHIDYRFVSDPASMVKKFGIAGYPLEIKTFYQTMECVNPTVFDDGSIPELAAAFKRQRNSEGYERIVEKCSAKKLKSCQKCPHQGLDLTDIEPTMVDGQMVKVCPNHGLTWNLETGKLLFRKAA